ncbi:hypothetical protein M0Q97_02205 [Candidatus Dojkabacteria bacterium]|jgi:hypothetical protein|nr:hypothetical protein [Candidatus Dojkabacteria bacterium]
MINKNIEIVLDENLQNEVDQIIQIFEKRRPLRFFGNMDKPEDFQNIISNTSFEVNKLYKQENKLFAEIYIFDDTNNGKILLSVFDSVEFKILVNGFSINKEIIIKKILSIYATIKDQ